MECPLVKHKSKKTKGSSKTQIRKKGQIFRGIGLALFHGMSKSEQILSLYFLSVVFSIGLSGCGTDVCVAGFGNCEKFFVDRGTLDVANKQVTLAFSSPPATLNINEQVTLRAIGGTKPYSWEISSGSGSINQEGRFTSPSITGTSTIRVTDNNKAQATTTITFR